MSDDVWSWIILSLFAITIFVLGFLGGRESINSDYSSCIDSTVELTQCRLDLFSEHQSKLHYISFIESNCSSGGLK